jgi:hypothetical protein
MDPIGFALENFDAIGVWRTQDESQAIDTSAQTFDGTAIDGPAGLRGWLVSKYSNLFVEVATEKLLTYALGRGLEHRDMPLVRAIARDARANNSRFSALVLGVVRSQPFQMNTKAPAPTPGQVADIRAVSAEKGNH